MSKDIQTSHAEITLTEFWGGLTRGKCIQIHTADPLAESDAIQLTKVQAEAAALALIDWLVPTPPPLALPQLAKLQATVRRVIKEPGQDFTTKE